MLHDLKTLHLDPAAAKFAAVLHGHTHVPNFYTKKGVLYFNPGSCGPRRFELPVTIGLLTIAKESTAHLKHRRSYTLSCIAVKFAECVSPF